MGRCVEPPLSPSVPQVWKRPLPSLVSTGVLQVNGTIQTLSLESNSISSAGVTAIAAALESNTSLRELKLANQR